MSKNLIAYFSRNGFNYSKSCTLTRSFYQRKRGGRLSGAAQRMAEKNGGNEWLI